MEKKELLYEGKAKKVFATEDETLCIVSYKDDATAFNGLKKGTVAGKGAVNNRMSNMLMQLLEQNGVPTHFVKELSERDTLVKKVKIVPLEVIIRNVSAGSFSKRYGVPEGIVFEKPTIEFSYKCDALGDPLLNDYHALALKLAAQEEIETIKKYAFKVNEVLKEYFLRLGVRLVDFKLEFGRDLTRRSAMPRSRGFSPASSPKSVWSSLPGDIKRGERGGRHACASLERAALQRLFSRAESVRRGALRSHGARKRTRGQTSRRSVAHSHENLCKTRARPA